MSISKKTDEKSVAYVPKDGASLTFSMLHAQCYQDEEDCLIVEDFAGGEVKPSELSKFKMFTATIKENPHVNKIRCEIYFYHLSGPSDERKATKKEIDLIVDDDFPNSYAYPNLSSDIIGEFDYYPQRTKVVRDEREH